MARPILGKLGWERITRFSPTCLCPERRQDPETKAAETGYQSVNGHSKSALPLKVVVSPYF